MHLCMHDHVSSMSWASTLLIVYRMNSITVCIQFPWQLSQLTTSDLSRPSASPRPWPQVSRMAPSMIKLNRCGLKLNQNFGSLYLNTYMLGQLSL